MAFFHGFVAPFSTKSASVLGGFRQVDQSQRVSPVPVSGSRVPSLSKPSPRAASWSSRTSSSSPTLSTSPFFEQPPQWSPPPSVLSRTNSVPPLSSNSPPLQRTRRNSVGSSSVHAGPHSSSPFSPPLPTASNPPSVGNSDHLKALFDRFQGALSRAGLGAYRLNDTTQSGDRIARMVSQLAGVVNSGFVSGSGREHPITRPVLIQPKTPGGSPVDPGFIKALTQNPEHINVFAQTVHRSELGLRERNVTGERSVLFIHLTGEFTMVYGMNKDHVMEVYVVQKSTVDTEVATLKARLAAAEARQKAASLRQDTGNEKQSSGNVDRHEPSQEDSWVSSTWGSVASTLSRLSWLDLAKAETWFQGRGGGK